MILIVTFLLLAQFFVSFVACFKIGLAKHVKSTSQIGLTMGTGSSADLKFKKYSPEKRDIMKAFTAPELEQQDDIFVSPEGKNQLERQSRYFGTTMETWLADRTTGD